MATSTILKTIYASAPDDVYRIQALIIKITPDNHVRLVSAFVDEQLGVNGEMLPFEPCGMDIELPAKEEGASQSLKFALAILDDDRVSKLVEETLENGQPIELEYREYLSTDRLYPAAAPIIMTVQGGVFESAQLGIEAAYQDLLNERWPRATYTLELAPGLKYQ